MLLAGCTRATPAPVEYRDSDATGATAPGRAATAASGAGKPVVISRAPSSSAAGPGNPYSVTVASGDTVYGISRREGVPMQSIIAANGLVPPYTLHVGQELVVPRPRLHHVKKGETLYAISRSYRVDVATLAKVNRIGPPYSLTVGQGLIVPVDHMAPAKVAGAPVKTTGPAAANAEAVEPVKVQPVKVQPVKVQPVKVQPIKVQPVKTAPGTVVKPSRANANPAVVAAPPSRAVAVSTRGPPPKTPTTRPAGRFVWPIDGRVISRYGVKDGGLQNDGINIAADQGESVRAAADGIVGYAGNELRGYGNLVLIRHTGGYTTAYAHNDVLLVKKGERVKRGQVIARVGRTGNVDRPQLHFEIRRGSQSLDPERYLVRLNADAEGDGIKTASRRADRRDPG